MQFYSKNPLLFIRNKLPIEVSRLILDINNNYLFKSILILKLFLIIFTTPESYSNWFIPFFQNAISINILSPWSSHLFAEGNIYSFPYGIVMYLLYLPLSFLFTLNSDNLINFEIIISIALGLTSLLFDYLTLIFIALITRKFSKKLLLIVYWCSPISIYILYVHGQLDILPVFLLILSLYLIKRNKIVQSSLALGMAISSKFSMIVTLPFLIIYLIRDRFLNKKVTLFLTTLITVLSILVMPFFFNKEYILMVIRSPELMKIFGLFINYGDDLSIYILPTFILLILYLFWRLQRITFDMFMMAVGLGFFILLLLLPPSPGWFLWVLPFLVFYQLRCPSDYLFVSIPFYVFYLIFFTLYSSGTEFLFFDLPYYSNTLINDFINRSSFKSFIFTGMQASGLLICLRMYIYGINRNNIFNSNSKLLLILIGGVNSASEMLADNLIDMFGIKFANKLSQSNYQKKYKLKSINKKTREYLHSSYYLSKFSNDIFKLTNKSYKYICNFRENSDNFLTQRKSNDLNFLFITGFHCLYLKRLSKRIDLKIFIDVDKKVKSQYSNIIFDKENPSFNKEEITKDERVIYHEQEKNADLIFRIKPINENYIQNSEDQFTPSKLCLTMANGYFHDELIHKLIAICSANISITNNKQSDIIELVIDAEISSEDIKQIAIEMIPDIYDLISFSTEWHGGLIGLIQIVVIKHIADLLKETF